MREFTDTEQKLVKALINNVSRKSGLRIGEVLLQVYPIEYIEKNKVDDPFYKETINNLLNIQNAENFEQLKLIQEKERTKDKNNSYKSLSNWI